MGRKRSCRIGMIGDHGYIGIRVQIRRKYGEGDLRELPRIRQCENPISGYLQVRTPAKAAIDASVLKGKTKNSYSNINESLGPAWYGEIPHEH